jgi:hypothetical protein
VHPTLFPRLGHGTLQLGPAVNRDPTRQPPGSRGGADRQFPRRRWGFPTTGWAPLDSAHRAAPVGALSWPKNSPAEACQRRGGRRLQARGGASAFQRGEGWSGGLGLSRWIRLEFEPQCIEAKRMRTREGEEKGGAALAARTGSSTGASTMALGG